MNFLYPQFLWALFALLIPIIIHLFSFRLNKVVYFSDIRFLKKIKQQTKSKTNLKNWLVLLMRLLALAALVTAFAQPYKSNDSSKQKKNVNKVGIYIDNSFSTEAEGKYGKLSETAKNKALAIVNAYPPGTDFLFLTNEFFAKHLHLLNAEQVKDFITETATAPHSRQTGDVLKKMTDFFKDQKDSADKHAIYLISDLQKSSHKPDKFPAKVGTEVYFLPVQAQVQHNILIDSAWFETPGRVVNQQDELFVSITNFSDKDYTDVPVNLLLNDSLKSPGSININAGETVRYKMTFTNTRTGGVSGRIELTDYPVTFDNRFYFSFDIPKQKSVRIISPTGDNKYIRAVFEADSYFTLSQNSEAEIKMSEIAEQDVIIIAGINSISEGLNAELVNFTSEGGTLIIFPEPKADLTSYNNLFNKFGLNYITGTDSSDIYISHINYNAHILRGIFRKEERNPDLPVIKERMKFSNITTAEEEGILFTESNEKALFKRKFGNGQVFVFAQAADIKAGNFVHHPLWAPLLYNMALFGIDDSKIYYTIGERETVRLKLKRKDAEELIKIRSTDSLKEFIPQVSNTDGGAIKIFPDANIKEAGIYRISLNQKYLRSIAYNYNRAESDLETYTTDEWQKIIENRFSKDYKIFSGETDLIQAQIQKKQSGVRLWKYFILAALAFLLAETLIIRDGIKLK